MGLQDSVSLSLIGVCLLLGWLQSQALGGALRSSGIPSVVARWLLMPPSSWGHFRRKSRELILNVLGLELDQILLCRPVTGLGYGLDELISRDPGHCPPLEPTEEYDSLSPREG